VSDRIRVACVQITSGREKALNLEKAEKLVAQAAATGADIVALPEKWNAIGPPDVLHDTAETIEGGESIEAMRGWAKTHGVTLAAYHLALDAHPEIGNNALLARKLGIQPRDRFLELGFGGPLDEPTDIEEFSARVRDVLNREPLVFAHGPERIERAAVVTGSAGRYLAAAAHEGYDLFLTGEAMEPTLHTARELGVHFVAGGHYATETIGIQALAAKLAERFGLEWEFLDLPNPV
jgi:dinuclear metal center YbgI/SA1388 family protein